MMDHGSTTAIPLREAMLVTSTRTNLECLAWSLDPVPSDHDELDAIGLCTSPALQPSLDTYIQNDRTVWNVRVDPVLNRWHAYCRHRSGDDLLLKSVHVLEDCCLEIEEMAWDSSLSECLLESSASDWRTLHLRGCGPYGSEAADIGRRLQMAIRHLDQWDDFVCASNRSESIELPSNDELALLVDQWQQRGECVVFIRNAQCTPEAAEQILDYIHRQGLAIRSAEVVTGGSNDFAVTPESASCPCPECFAQVQQLWAAAQARSLHASVPTTLILGVAGSGGATVDSPNQLGTLRELCLQLGGPECSVEVYLPKSVPAETAAMHVQRCRTCSGSSTCISSDTEEDPSSENEEVDSLVSGGASYDGPDHFASCSSDTAMRTTATGALPSHRHSDEATPTTDEISGQGASAIQDDAAERSHGVVIISSVSSLGARSGPDCDSAPSMQRPHERVPDERAVVKLVSGDAQKTKRCGSRLRDRSKAGRELSTKSEAAERNISLVSEEPLRQVDDTLARSQAPSHSRWPSTSKARNRPVRSAWPSSNRPLRGERSSGSAITTTTTAAATAAHTLTAADNEIDTRDLSHRSRILSNLFVSDIPHIKVEYDEELDRFQVHIDTHSRPGITFDLVRAFRALNLAIERASVARTDRVPRVDARASTHSEAAVETRTRAQILLQIPKHTYPGIRSFRWQTATRPEVASLEAQLRSTILDVLCNPIWMRNRPDGAVTCVDIRSPARDGRLGDLLRFVHASRLRVRRARMRTHGTRVHDCLYLTDMVMQKAVPSLLWADLRAQMLAAVVGVDCLALIHPTLASLATIGMTHDV